MSVRSMSAAALAATALCTLLAATVVIAAAPPQSRQRDRGSSSRDGIGLADDDWCRDGNFSRRRSFCDVREQTLSDVRVLDADTGGNGGIYVRGSDRRDVRLRARVLAFADTADAAERVARDIRLDIHDGRIRVDGPRRDNDEGWSVTFELEVPRQLEMRLATRNGGIRVERYAGRAMLQTQNGGLRLDDVGGDVQGRTVNGGIRIDLSGRRWAGQGLDVETRNGGISMSLPADYSADLDLSTVNGGVSIDFPVTVQGNLLSRMNRHITTSIGSGGPRLRATTTNGGIRVGRS